MKNQYATKLRISAWIILVSAALLTSATFAWMTMGSSLSVTNLTMMVIADNALLVAADEDGTAGEFTSVLDLSDLFAEGAVLRPVTYSAQADAFMAPVYGLDGRIESLTTMLLNTTAETPNYTLMAEGDEDAGYLLAVDVWFCASESACAVTLSPPTDVVEGSLGGGTYLVGAPVWNAQTYTHDDGGKGAQYAIRVGFRSYDENGETENFVIYEPNATGEETTSIDGTGEYISADSYIAQGVSSWSEQSPILKDNVDYTLGEFLTDEVLLFELEKNEPKLVTIYIWLEGMDESCDNSISAAELLMNLQFVASEDLTYDYLEAR